MSPYQTCHYLPPVPVAPSPLNFPEATIVLIFILIRLACSRTSCARNYTVWTHLRLFSFTQHNVFESHPYYAWVSSLFLSIAWWYSTDLGLTRVALPCGGQMDLSPLPLSSYLHKPVKPGIQPQVSAPQGNRWPFSQGPFQNVESVASVPQKSGEREQYQEAGSSMTKHPGLPTSFST